MREAGETRIHVRRKATTKQPELGLQDAERGSGSRERLSLVLPAAAAAAAAAEAAGARDDHELMLMRRQMRR